MSIAHDQSPRALEREADETRHRLASSLDELAANLTPGRMLDEVLSYARAGGADFLRGLGNAASANPMPTLLIGLGAAMFLTGKGRVDSGDGSATHSTSVLRHAADAMRRRSSTNHAATQYGAGLANAGRAPAAGSNVAEMAARAGRGAASAASDVASGVGSAASTAAGAVGSAASSAAGAVGSAASGAAGAVRSAAGAVGSAASTAADAVGSAASSAADAVGSAAGTVGSTAARVADQARSGAAAVGSAAADAATAVRDAAAAGVGAAADFASTAGEFASSAADSVAGTARAAADTVSQEGQYLFDQVTELARDLSRRTNRLIQEQPLAVAAAGLAIGAAIAAVLPRSRAEDEYLGKTSDAVKETVAEAATEQFQRAKEVTGRVVEEVKHVAEKEGISATAAADAVRDIGEKVKHVVTAAGEKATEAAERNADDKWQMAAERGKKSDDKGWTPQQG